MINVAKKNLEAGLKFLAENKTKDGVITISNGLQYKVITEGSGDKPTIKDTVKCHYEGRLIDGTIFDSSYKGKKPLEFPVYGVIGGWIQALQMMNVGSLWELYLPTELAYGRQGAGRDIGPNEALVFKVELLQIK